MRELNRVVFLLFSFFISTISPALSQMLTVTDIAGRQVDVKIPAEKIILGEARQIYFLAVLDRDNPFQRVTGWRDDLPKFDPEIYAAYLKKYPQIADLPTFGLPSGGSFSFEQAIHLAPDVILMNLDQQTAMQEGGHLETLEAVGIPVIFVDFRELKNTESTLRLIGKLIDKEDITEDFISFRARSIERVRDRIDRANPVRPVVFIERAAGWFEECCMSYGRENFGLMVELAGGINLAGDMIPGTLGMVNPEQVIAANPEHYIATSSNWQAQVPGGGWVGVGYGADLVEARRKLEALIERPVFTEIQARKEGNIHAIWHQFLANPYQFVAIEQIAKWLHPDLFADLDPEATFRELHERFLPLDYSPGYFLSLRN